MNNYQKVGVGIGGLVLAGTALLTDLRMWEGVRGQPVLTVYADKLAYGVPTVCSGHTDWKLVPGQSYTKADCDKIDGKIAREYGEAVLKCIGEKNLDQNMLDAMTLFAINVGKAGACGSRAAQLMRAGRHIEGCRAISHGPQGQRVWSTSGGQFRRGLANRRDFERELCLKPVAKERAVS
jgi:lysozyme